MKLCKHIESLLQKVYAYDFKTDIEVFRCINPYYYLQKEEELLAIHCSSTKQRLSEEQINKHYEEVYHQWRQDARWLNRYFLFKIPCAKSFAVNEITISKKL